MLGAPGTHMEDPGGVAGSCPLCGLVLPTETIWGMNWRTADLPVTLCNSAFQLNKVF